MLSSGIGGGSSFDPDAAAYFAALPTDPGDTFKNAWNTFVVSAKANGYYTNFTALYPFPGTDADNDAVNAADPETFEITWAGTVTHDENGITPNGSTGYGDTGLNALSVLTEDDAHISIYSRSNVGDNADYDIGAFSGNDQILINPRNGSNLTEFRIIYSVISASNSDSRGLFLGSRRSQTDFEAYKNGVSIGTNTTSQAGLNLPNLNILVGALNNAGTPSFFSPRNLCIASAGSAFSDTQAADYYTDCQALQTTLSRQV